MRNSAGEEASTCLPFLDLWLVDARPGVAPKDECGILLSVVGVSRESKAGKLSKSNEEKQSYQGYEGRRISISREPEKAP